MRDQYAGDISDFLKYALLRALARDDRKLGVAWYYNMDRDKRPDGKHIDYIQEDRWRSADEQLWLELNRFYVEFQRNPDFRKVTNIEQLRIWPVGTIFHGTNLEESVPRYLRNRPCWADLMTKQLSPCNLVFLDPDNSIHRKPTIRHTTYEEITGFHKHKERALLLIKFPAHINHEDQLRDYTDSLQKYSEVTNSLTLRTKAEMRTADGRRLSTLFRWFTLTDFDQTLEDRFRSFAARLDTIDGVTASL